MFWESRVDMTFDVCSDYLLHISRLGTELEIEVPKEIGLLLFTLTIQQSIKKIQLKLHFLPRWNNKDRNYLLMGTSPLTK